VAGPAGLTRAPPAERALSFEHDERRRSDAGRGAAREAVRGRAPKAFFDAVVAIAMTLLILPLMESVGEVADASGTTLRGSNG